MALELSESKWNGIFKSGLGKIVLPTLGLVAILALFFFAGIPAGQAGEEDELQIDLFIQEYDRIIDGIEEGDIEPTFFFGKKYRYCLVFHDRLFGCRDCTSRGIGGTAGKVYCGIKCGGSPCSVLTGYCSEPRNHQACRP